MSNKVRLAWTKEEVREMLKNRPVTYVAGYTGLSPSEVRVLGGEYETGPGAKWTLINKILNMARSAAGKPLVDPASNPYAPENRKKAKA